MKYFWLFVFVMSSIDMSAQILEHWTVDNSFLESPMVRTTFRDSQNRIWLSDLDDLFYRDNDGWHDVTDSIKSKMVSSMGGGLAGIMYISEDKYGNIIATNNVGMAIYNNRDWQVFSARANTHMNFIYSTGFCNDKLYFTSAGTYGLRLMNYDSTSKKYSHSITDVIQQPDSITSLYKFEVQGSTLIILADSGLALYHTETNSWGFISQVNGFSLRHCNSFTHRQILMNKYGVISILSTIEDSIFSGHPEKDVYHTEITRIYGNVSAKSYPVYNRVWKKALPHSIIYIDEAQDSLLLAYENQLYLFHESFGYKLIPKPDTISPTDWIIFDLFKVSENEIWLGTAQAGIYVCDLKQLLNTATTANVEIDPYLPNMSISSIYPQPNSNFVNFEYYLQSGLFTDSKVSVFDWQGKKIDNISYESTNRNGMINNILLNTSNLPNGVYLIQIDNGTSKATEKFIIDR